MLTQNTISYNIIWWIKAYFWNSIRISRRILRIASTKEQIADRDLDAIAPFDEYPPCELCGHEKSTEQLVTQDLRHIVSCNQCNLWFTSPRINEETWIEWLKTPSPRSIEFTENRLNYGKALTSNIRYAYPNWYKQIADDRNKIIDKLENFRGQPITRLHDVGCGVGFLLRTAAKRDIKVSGNELNAYACSVMRERLGLEVYNDHLPNLLARGSLQPSTIDAVVMSDYIEHTYHPLADLTTAYNLLMPGGVMYIATFHIECRAFDELGKNWNMLFWNHVYHFSKASLEEMLYKAGFERISTKAHYESMEIEILAQKHEN